MSASALAGAREAVPRSRARIDLTLARLEGLFGLVFAILSIPVLNASVHTLRPEWAWGVPIALFGSIAVSLVCAVTGRGVRLGMALFALVFVVTLLLWPLAVRSPEAALGTQPWLWYIVTVACGAAAIAFPTAWAAVYIVGVPVLFAVLRVLPAGGGVSVSMAVLDAVYPFVLGSCIVIVVTILRLTASRVDAARLTAMERYAEAAKRHAAEQERTRVDTVIHDRVLSTLLAAARSTSPDDRRLAVQMAERALVALQSAEAETDGTAELPFEVLIARCRALAETLVADIEFSIDGDTSGTLPARVIEGAYSATVQAIENSVQHAGPAEVTRCISLHAVRDPGGAGRLTGFSVVVADSGRGFDVDSVPGDRLGLRISIRERMLAVGGRAEVRSVVGGGTSVVISWPQTGGPGGDRGGDS
jgi:signal transduction histidine kinase